MRKIFLLLAVAALVVLPSLALAQTEFSLGGYIKLDSFWDSTSMNKNLTSAVTRGNNPTGQHGRFNATSQSSRFNFTIKGPKLWGAQITGFIEMDFDNDVDARKTSGNNYTPRLRHAFFRMNWPGTELLMGQYWGLLSTFQPETIQDAGMQSHGFPATDRFAQVRLTQDFGLGWAKNDKLSLSLLVGKPVDVSDANFNPIYQGNTGGLPAQTSETPQIQGGITYEGDLWGKAAFYGRPKGFTAQVAGGWQRTQYAKSTDGQAAATATGLAFANSGYLNRTVGQDAQQYLNNWVFQGSLFIPVIPTATANLSGTLSLTATAYLGEGLEFIGNATGQNSYLHFNGPAGPLPGASTNYSRILQQVWGGNVQLQYYFSNEWFLNFVIGTGQNYGVDRSRDVFFTDAVKGWWEADLALYYRPITALKFGLGYAYSRTDYFQKRTAANQVNVATAPGTTPGPNARDYGDSHRVEFGAWFFF